MSVRPRVDMQDRTGNSRWSAPVYFFVSQMGIGLSAGYETVRAEASWCRSGGGAGRAWRCRSHHEMLASRALASGLGVL